MKHLLTLICCICFLQCAYAQKYFQVTIHLDTSIIPKRVFYHYNDGQKLVTLKDSARSASLSFKGEYNSIYVDLDIVYFDKDDKLYFDTFFIGEKPAEIDLYYNKNPNQLLLHRRLVNATAAYDTTTNKVYREMLRDNRESSLATYIFYEKYKDRLNTSDSLRNVYAQMIRSNQSRTMQFLRKHPGEYFSFWYFQYQLAALRPSKADTAYLKEQLAYFKSVFPAKFTQSNEGKELIQAFERKLNPLQVNGLAPAFRITTIDGKRISLANLKGQYVLLDFWATWCVPCMKEMPFIRSFAKKYASGQLAVIGISRDYDLATLKRTIKKERMNWMHFFDKDTKISRLYGVNEFPTLILLNKESKIIYRTDGTKDDTRELPKVLQESIHHLN